MCEFFSNFIQKKRRGYCYRLRPSVRLYSRMDPFVFVAAFLGCTSTGQVGLWFFVVLCPGTPEGSTGSGSGFKASQKTGQRLKVSSHRLGEAGNRTCDPWCTRHRFIPYTTADGLFFPTHLPNLLVLIVSSDL